MGYRNSNPDNIRFPALGRSLDHQTSSRSVALRPSFAEIGFAGFRPFATAPKPQNPISRKQSPKSRQVCYKQPSGARYCGLVELKNWTPS